VGHGAGVAMLAQPAHESNSQLPAMRERATPSVSVTSAYRCGLCVSNQRMMFVMYPRPSWGPDGMIRRAETGRYGVPG